MAMEFQFSEEEKLLQWAVNDFAQKELAEEEIYTSNHVPQKIIEKMGRLGFLALKIPEKYGGTAGTWTEVGILVEEIAKKNIAVAHLIMRCYEIGSILAGHGTEKIKTEWLSGVAKGRKAGCIAATESGSGSEIAAIKTNALRENDSYLITGEKNPISFGMQADFGIVFAKTDPYTGSNGISAFLVPLDLPGITKASITNMGLHGSAVASIVFDQVKIPFGFRIGEEGDGFDINVRQGLFSSLSRVLSGIIPLGACQAALDLAVSYSKKRFAFGRPLAKFQAISGKIAEAATLVEAGRWLCYRALWLKEKNLPHAGEAAMSSWWCPKIAYNVIKDALLIHGHTGYTDELPLERMLRDVTAFEIIGGSDQLMKLIIAYKAMGTIAVPDDILAYVGDQYDD
jgi:cyclohexanecarboxyl-CoA dehydrogenase